MHAVPPNTAHNQNHQYNLFTYSNIKSASEITEITLKIEQMKCPA